MNDLKICLITDNTTKALSAKKQILKLIKILLLKNAIQSLLLEVTALFARH